jgi:predicted ABC-type ATPase
MPDYTIIAGPNGAGKSTFSAILSSADALVFDADKVKAIKEKEYPDLPDENIEMMITSAYWEAEDIAIAEKKDLTVETNLRNEFLINRLSFFKSKGYTTNLIYMLLPDVATSTERVALRIAQKGHFIDSGSIKYNFEQGLVMLKKHFNMFDTLEITESSLNNDLAFPKRLLMLKNNNVHFIEPNAPIWGKPILDEIVQKLTTK